MKKLGLIWGLAAVALLSFTHRANAQKGFQLGVQGTPQSSFLINADDSDNDMYKALFTFNSSFGISTQYGFTDNVGIGLNVLYSFQGQRYEYNNVERNKCIQYIKIPLMFNYSFGISDNMRFLFKIGPQLGLLTSAKVLDEEREVEVDDFKDAFENYDVGGVAYLGIGFGLTDKLSLDASLRFDSGFTNAENPDYTGSIHEPNNGGPISTDRATTMNMSGGLTIGLRYTFM